MNLIFVEFSNLELIITLALFILFIIIFILACVISNVITNRNQTKIKKNICFDNIYLFDFNANRVTYFSSNMPEKKKIITYKEFIGKFSRREQNRLDTFIQGLLHYEENDEKEFLAIVNEDRVMMQKAYYEIFAVNFIDYDNKKLSLIGSKLMNIPVYNLGKNKDKIVKKIGHEILISQNNFENKYKKGEFSEGCIFLIKFLKKSDVYCDYNEAVIRYKLIDYLFGNLNTFDFYLLKEYEKPLEIIFVDNNIITLLNSSRYLTRLNSLLNKFIEINGLDNFYDTCAISSKVNRLSKDFSKAKIDLIKFSINASSDSKATAVYEPESKELSTIREGYRQEVDRITKNSAYNVYFRPIIRITPRGVKIIGYQYKYELKKSQFKSFVDYLSYAKRFNFFKEVFTGKTKKVIGNFVSLKDDSNIRLFMRTSFDELIYSNSVFSHLYNIDNANICLVFENNEFIDYENDDEYLNNITSFEKRGFDCGLVTKINDYILKDNTYRLFDYFIFDFEEYNDIKQNSKEYYGIHSLLEKFVKFNKPILCINVKSLTMVELFVQMGVYYFSSPAISDYDSKLLTIDKKLEKKLINML